MQSRDTSTPTGTIKQDIWKRRAFEKQLVNVLPDLRAMARILTRNNSAADDLMQDTVVRALRACDRFEPDTSMKAWTFRILHNCHINSFRRRRTVANIDEIEDLAHVPPNQEDNLNLKDVLSALDRLVPAHREAIMLVRASGVTYEEAATIMSCKIGTIKSRINRADAALRAALGTEYAADTGFRATAVSGVPETLGPPGEVHRASAAHG